MANKSNILLLLSGAAIVYYLINKNKINNQPVQNVVIPKTETNSIQTINNLVQKAADPVPIDLKTKTGTVLTAIQTGTSINQPLYTTILQTRAGDLPITASANFIQKNKTSTLQNLAITQNILNTQTDLMPIPADPGLLPEQILPTVKTGNLITTIKKGFL